MNSLSHLVEWYDLDHADIGRFQFATNSWVDCMKLIKSFVMAHPEEVDVVAHKMPKLATCAVVNALYSALSWVQEDLWNGKMIVICCDSSLHGPIKQMLLTLTNQVTSQMLSLQCSVDSVIPMNLSVTRNNTTCCDCAMIICPKRRACVINIQNPASKVLFGALRTPECVIQSFTRLEFDKLQVLLV